MRNSPVQKGRASLLSTFGAFLSILVLAGLCSEAIAIPDEIVESGQKKIELSLEEVITSGTANTDRSDVKAQPLSMDRVAEIVNRLPPISEPSKKEFVLPEQSLLRPELPGGRIAEKFPPDESGPKIPKRIEEVDDLRILKVSHSGEFDVVGQLTITFSQPMVAISKAGAELNPEKFVRMTPRAKGKWRWLGTQTLLFEPDSERLPKSTHYRLTIPSGLESIQGGKLEKEKTWTVSTVQPYVETFVPRDTPSVTQIPEIVAVFNQRIDKASVLQHLTVSAKGRAYQVQEISPTSQSNKELTEGLEPDRWIAVRPISPLPLDSTITASFEPGYKSLEGPRVSSNKESFSFHVYGPLKVESSPKSGLSPDDWQCRRISFNNPIDMTSFSPSMVSIEPAVPNLEIGHSPQDLLLDGRLLPETKYKVTISKDVKDTYGQTLGHKKTFRFKTGTYGTALSFDRVFTTIPHSQKPTCILRAQGSKKVELTVYKVEPKDCLDFLSAKNPIDRFTNKNSKWELDHTEQAISRKSIKLKPTDREICIDLARYFENDFGQLVISAKMFDKATKKELRASTMVQRTDLSIDAFSSKKMVALVTSLETGEPRKGVYVKAIPSGKDGETDENGLVELPLTMESNESRMLVASRGKDRVILPASENGRYGWFFRKSPDKLKWYGVTDRNLYKPGETVHIKGWSRKLSFSDAEKLQLAIPEFTSMRYRVTDSNGKEMALGKTNVDRSGGFSLDFKIPEKVDLGYSTISLSVPETKKIKDATKESSRRSTEYNYEKAFRSDFDISFNIQEFRPPEYEMKLSSSAGNSLMIGDSTTLKAKASYFTGGSLQGAPISWTVQARPSYYSPPGWNDYYFNSKSPKWSREDISDGTTVNRLALSANKDGESAVKFTVESAPEPRPLNCTCEATFTDVNRQTWSDSVHILVHPSEVYVGVKENWEHDRHDIKEQLKLDIVAVDLDGKPQEGCKIELELLRMNQNAKNENEPKTVEKRSLVSRKAKERLVLNIEEAGEYQIAAVVTDSKGHKNETVFNTYIGEVHTTQVTELNKDRLVLKADKAKYQPGETVELEVTSPFAPARGVMNIRRSTILKSIPIELDSRTKTFKIPVKEEFVPNFWVEVYLVGDDYRYASEVRELSVPPTDKELALSAKAVEQVVKPGTDTEIEIELTDAKGAPVANGQVALAIVDEAILALSGYSWHDPLAVFYSHTYHHIQDVFLRNTVILTGKEEDERQADDLANLPPPSALPPPPLPGAGLVGAPVDPRYGQSNEVGRINGPRDMNMFAVEPEVLEEGRSKAPIQLRNNFNSLALFKSAIITDLNGRATVKVHLPDNLSRFRIMAVAVADADKFGATESSITVKMPLMVKPSAPRFLNYGDIFELPLVLRNETDKHLSADVVLRAVNAELAEQTHDLTLKSASIPLIRIDSQTAASGVAGKRVLIPANDRVEVRFPTLATNVGSANFQCAVVAGDDSDASQISIPVHVPASMESFATYGDIIKGSQAQKLNRPTNVFPQVGGLTISSSSTALQSLTDAYLTLRDYEFECSEQLSSRIIAMISLTDVLSAFEKVSEKERSELRASIQSNIDELLRRQNSNGSIGLWKSGEDEQFPYVSIQVAKALALAKENDFVVEVQNLDLSRKYLKSIKSHIPPHYPDSLKRSIEAHALSALYLMGESDSKKAAELIERSLGAMKSRTSRKEKIDSSDPYEQVPIADLEKELSVECASWLLPVVASSHEFEKEKELLHRLIASRINETSSTASTAGSGYGEFNYCCFYSPRRTDAIVMEALLAADPSNPLIPKLAKGLLAHRKNGAWSGTQENSYILQALKKYFDKYEKESPNFNSHTWLGKTLVANSKFFGRTTETKETTIPMSSLRSIAGDTITLAKDGPGRLYYRIGIDHAPRQLKCDPADFGFGVKRTYHAIDNKSDVYKDKDGVWHFKAGALIKTKVQFTSTGARYHIALADPLPAGVEPVNTALLGNRNLIPEEENSKPEGFPFGFRNIDWFNHQNLRNHQAEAFSSLLYAGNYEYEYRIQATTIGRFIVPPTKVEEMYSPETFGRSASDIVVVE